MPYKRALNILPFLRVSWPARIPPLSSIPEAASLKRPRAAAGAESLRRERHNGGRHTEMPMLESARAANTSTPQYQQHNSGSDDDGGGGGLSLPWLADRFYLNVLASLRGGQQSDGRLARDSGGGCSGGCSSGSSNSSSNGVDTGGYAEGEYANGPFFSLERLVEVVSGDDWPDIKAALFGTFSLEIGYVSASPRHRHIQQTTEK